MSELEPTLHDAEASPYWKKFLRRHALYLAALVLALAGVAYTNAAHQPLTGYWELLAIVMAVICVVTQWENVPERDARLRLVGTQALHWAAVLVAMNIMVLNRVQSMAPAPALSLVLLTLLSLGAFLAGVSLLSVPICFLGLAMALSVPAIAWLTQSFLFLVLALLLVAGLGVAFWPRSRD